MDKKLSNDYFRIFPDPSISAQEVGAWSVLTVSVAYWANIARVSNSGSIPLFQSTIQGVLDNGAFDVMAWMLVLASIGRIFDAGPASGRQIRTAFLAGAVALIPVRQSAAAALVILALAWLRDPGAPRGRRNVALIFLALALETFWISSTMPQLHLFVARLDANVVVFLLGFLDMGATAHGNVVNNITMNFSISVWPYCASSTRLAGVALAFVAMTSYFGQSPRRGHLPWLGMSFVASIALTEMRLMFLAMGPDSYDWWHDGPGAALYSMTSLGLAVLFPVLATRVFNTSRALSDAGRAA